MGTKKRVLWYYVQARPLPRARWASWWPRDDQDAFAWVTLREDAASWTLDPEQDCEHHIADLAMVRRAFAELHAPRKFEYRKVPCP